MSSQLSNLKNLEIYQIYVEECLRMDNISLIIRFPMKILLIPLLNSFYFLSIKCMEEKCMKTDLYIYYSYFPKL